MTSSSRPADAIEWVKALDILGMRFGLERMRAVLGELGHPEKRPAIHIVGTNGKSSTTRMAAAILTEEGYRVGAYTSPHVSDWPERVAIDGTPVPLEELASALAAVRDLADRRPPEDPITQFEALTGAAFLVFARRSVEVMVVEAGLGGRYDATNVLDDAVVVLTNVSLEHTDLLGETEGEIAAEKLAVAGRETRAVVGRLEPAARAAVEAELGRLGITAWREGAEVTSVSGADGERVRTPLGTSPAFSLPAKAAFVRDNAATAVAAVERFLGRQARAGALEVALPAASLPGRLERFESADGSTILLDGAHNPAGMRALAEVIPDVVPGGPPVAVVSILGDKDVGAMLGELAGRCRRIVLTRSTHRRSASPERLAEQAEAAGLPYEIAATPGEALQRAREQTEPEAGVLVCGSLYVLADIRAELVEAGGWTPATLARACGPAARTP